MHLLLIPACHQPKLIIGLLVLLSNLLQVVVLLYLIDSGLHIAR